MTHLFTRSKLARLVSLTHISRCSLRTTTTTTSCSLRLFSTKTTANCGGEQTPETERRKWKHRRMELPEELSKNVIVLSCESTAKGGVCDVYVVGIVHMSKKSTQQVEAIVKYLKPEIVFLELCKSREQVLYREKIKVPTEQEMLESWKKKHNMSGILYSWFMAELANELDVYPGAEFRSGYREAIKYGGKVVLGDRPIQITLKRTWSKLPLWHISRLLIPSFSVKCSPSLSIFDNVKNWIKELEEDDGSILDSKIMNEKLPTVMETIVHERDKYMSYTLLKVASERRSVVAVVGKGHLQGIKKYWKQPVKIQDLLTVPPPKPAIPTMEIFVSVGILVAGVAIISNTYL
ncbi:unnamed protein product [Vicia faba]|uniref:TraB family protein n=1 Tax=Vicia faba TaxID=3906 RepID=A0AAV1AZT0_VICFA|nr:unnamed protein product [Vicia faba]